MGRLLTAAAVCVSLVIPWSATPAELMSKTYEFKAGVILEIGASTADGLRLDSVRFQMPTNAGVRTAREATVEVSISNTAGAAKRVGVALALFDGAGRLVGVADGGTSLVPLRAGRQTTYKLVFKNVNSEAPRTATFQISVESRD